MKEKKKKMGEQREKCLPKTDILREIVGKIYW